MIDIKISIIIPVYNAEKYIENMLKSIEKQTLKEIELLFIDDGSTDSSINIILKYKKNFSNIRLFKQNNMGAGKARNLGIENAHGEFICFIDADDFYVTEDALEYLYYLAKKENVNICGGCSCNYKNGKLSFVGLREERKFIKNQYVKKEDFPGITGFWAYIYKREFLLTNKIFFPDYVRGQDLVFFVKAISYSGELYCSCKLIYAYRINHKRVKYDKLKALSIVNSIKDVFEISIRNNMRNIQQIIYEELEGEIGALIYKYCYEGCIEMQKLAQELNSLSDKLVANRQLLLDNERIITYIQENEKEKQKFLDQIKNVQRVYIFGTGTVGKKVSVFLENYHIKVNAYIVSDIKRELLLINSIPVKEIERINTKNNDYIVIIATYWHSQEEIIEMLKRKKIDNIYIIDLKSFFLWQETIEH